MPKTERRSPGVIVDDAIAQTGWNDSTVVQILLEYIENQGDNWTFPDFIAEKVQGDLDD